MKNHSAAPQAALIDPQPDYSWLVSLLFSQCSKTTSHLDFLLYQKLRAWAKRRHPNKTGHWIASRY